MRHYINKRNNPNALPHNLYMQMLYILRDYEEARLSGGAEGREEQWLAVETAARKLRLDYEEKEDACGTLNPLRAFFDFPYFSYMFAQKSREMGASKRTWNLYRCRFAHLVAERLGLL